MDAFDELFESGYVPHDEPPGIEEREYRKWRDAGGKVNPKKMLERMLADATERRQEILGDALAELDTVVKATEAEMERRHAERMKEIHHAQRISYLFFLFCLVMLAIQLALRFWPKEQP